MPDWTENRLTTKLGIQNPIIQGPLGGLAGRRSDANAFNRSLASLAGHIAALGAPRPVYHPWSWMRFEDQARVLLDEKVPVFSFIYGIPPREILDECRANKIVTIGTA